MIIYESLQEMSYPLRLLTSGSYMCHYKKSREERGRPPIGLERMLRVYFVQQWNGLSDEGVEDAITDSQAVRAFVGIDLSREGRRMRRRAAVPAPAGAA
jgi:hypothetical protein